MSVSKKEPYSDGASVVRQVNWTLLVQWVPGPTVTFITTGFSASGVK